MPDSFDPLDYLEFLRGHWKQIALSVGTAAVATLAISLLLPNRYTATATLLIDPPSANDPRGTTAVSSVYLESLRTYEEFANSDSLFAKACEKFHLAGDRDRCADSFKRSVLGVTKLKDTKVLRLSVTLPKPEQAHALVQYLAEQTVQLNQSLAQAGDQETLNDIRKQLVEARKDRDHAQQERDSASATGVEFTLWEQFNNLSGLISQTDLELLRTKTELAEDTTGGNPAAGAVDQARATVLTQQSSEYERKRSAASAALANVRSHQDRAEQALKAAQVEFDTWTRRLNETDAASGSRTERLRVIDPGIVPQQRSFPNPPLFVGVAVLISSVLSLTFLTMRYGYRRRRAGTEPHSLQLARAEFIGPPIESKTEESPKELRVTRSANR